jgi:hypothetical protein
VQAATGVAAGGSQARRLRNFGAGIRVRSEKQVSAHQSSNAGGPTGFLAKRERSQKMSCAESDFRGKQWPPDLLLFSPACRDTGPPSKGGFVFLGLGIFLHRKAITSALADKL